MRNSTKGLRFARPAPGLTVGERAGAAARSASSTLSKRNRPQVCPRRYREAARNIAICCSRGHQPGCRGGKTGTRGHHSGRRKREPASKLTHRSAFSVEFDRKWTRSGPWLEGGEQATHYGAGPRVRGVQRARQKGEFIGKPTEPVSPISQENDICSRTIRAVLGHASKFCFPVRTVRRTPVARISWGDDIYRYFVVFSDLVNVEERSVYRKYSTVAFYDDPRPPGSKQLRGRSASY